LTEIAAERVQLQCLLLGLDTFGNDSDPQFFGDTNQTFNDRCAAAAMLKSVHKRLIDLDIVYRRVEIFLSLHSVQESSFNGFCGASKLNT
jgi:hypothetical protein